MDVQLRRASEDDALLIWRMQVRSFMPLLVRYGDASTNPAAEQAEKVLARIRQPFSDYYLICAGGVPVGAVRVVRRDAERNRISPIFVVPEHQRRGIARSALLMLEEMYPDVTWELNTILEEEGNCRLYEKLGYRRTGEYERINDRMTLVYYRKRKRQRSSY